MENTNFLQFGDLFVMQGFRSTKKKGLIEGYLSAFGYIDTRVFFQTNETSILDKSNIINNQRDMVFQIWPNLNYEAHKEYRKYKRIQSMQAKKENKQQEFSVDSLIPILITYFIANLSEEALLLQRKKEEAEHNAKGLIVGSNVFYGAEIQIMHVDSKAFLNGKTTTSEVDKSAYTFQLSNDYSSGMIFRIVPKYKLSQMGEPIQYNAVVLLNNVKLNSYITFSHDQSIEIDRPLDLSNVENTTLQNPNSKSLPLPNILTHDPNSLRFQSCLSQFMDTYWRLKYHGPALQTTTSLKGCDLIRLRHTELNGVLASEQSLISQMNQEVFLRLYKGSHEGEINSVSSIWEIYVNQEQSQGSYYTSSSKMYLKHLLTGSILSFEKRTFEEQEKMVLVLSSDQSSIKELVLVPTTKQAKETFQANECFLLQLDDRYIKAMTLKQEDVKQIHDNTKKIFFQLSSQPFYYLNEESVHIDEYFQQLKPDEEQVDRRAMELSEKRSEKDAFWIERLTDIEKSEILFVLSGLAVLRRLAMIFRAKQLEELNEEFLESVKRTLTLWIFFIIDYNGVNDAFTCEGESVISRQRVMKQCYVMDILTDILYQPFLKKLYPTIKDIPFAVIQIFQLSYRLIRFSINEYRPNEMYMSQWIELIISQTMYDDKVYDIMAGDTLTHLIVNNRVVLETKIKAETFDRFIAELLRTKTPKYLHLLRALVSSDGQAMIKNQIELSNKLLQQSVLKQLIIPMKMTGDNIQIEVAGSYYDLIQFKQKCQEVNYFFSQFFFLKKLSPNTFEYFYSLIKLFSDLCLDSNFLAINPLKEIYTIELCNFVISGDNYQPKIKEAFTCLFINLWIKGVQYQKIQIPNYIRDMKSIINLKSINTLFPVQENDTSKFVYLKRFAEVYLRDQTELGFQQLHKTQKNLFTQRILQMIDNFVQYGLYQDIKELQATVIHILAYLNGGLDVRNDGEVQGRRRWLEQHKHHCKTREINFSTEILKSRTVKTSSMREDYSSNSKYQINVESRILMQNRCLCCQILLKVQMLLCDLRASYVLYQCYKQQEAQEKDQSYDYNSPDLDKRRLISPRDMSTYQLKKVFLSKKGTLTVQQFSKSSLLNGETVIQEIEGGLKQLEELNLALIAPVNFDAVLMDMLMYDNDQLIQLSFTLFYNNYKRQQILANYMQQIQIIETSEHMKVYHEAKEIYDHLYALAQDTETWWGLKQTQQDQFAQCLQRLLILITSPAYEKQILHEAYLDAEILQSCIQQTYQKLFVNLNIHQALIDVIIFDLQTIREIRLIDPTPILVLSYKLLACLAYNNQDNKKKLEQHLDLFVEHLEINQGALSALALQEIFRDNREILMNQSKLEKTVRGLLRIMTQLDHKNKIKILLLESLKTYMTLNNNSLLPNQITVISCLLSHQYHNIKLNFNMQRYKSRIAQKPIDTFIQLCKKFTSTLNQALSQSQSSNQLQLPEFLQYFAILLKVISIGADNKNAAVESKGQNYLSIDVIHSLMEKAQQCWNLKYALADFFFNVYLETEKKNEEDHDLILNILKILLADLQYIIQNHLLLSHCQVQIVDIRGPKPLYSIIEMYLLDGIIVSFQQVVNRNMLQGHPDSANFLKQAVKSVIDLSNITINQKVLSRISSFLKEINNNNKVSRDIQYKTHFEPLVPATLQGLVKSKTHNLNSQYSVLFSESVQDVVNEVLRCQDFKQRVEEEFECIVATLSQIETISEKAFLGLNTLTFNQILARLIKLVNPDNKLLNNELTKMALCVFRKVVEMELPDVKESASNWSFNQYEPYLAKIVQRQDQLIDIGLVNVVCRILQPDSPVDLKHQAILLAVSLLVGGNRKSQAAFLKYFINDEKNSSIIELKVIIEDNFNVLKRSMIGLNRSRDCHQNGGALAEQQINEIFSEEGDQLVLTSEQSDEFDAFILKMTFDVFRFLQLLCQGHNEALQSYLREQVQNGVINGKSVNLLQFSLSRLSSVSKLINLELTPLVGQTFNFLIEASQGPCLANQQSLLQSKVVDFSRDLMTSFSNQQIYQRRGFISQSQIKICNNLLNKVTKLLLSLIEGTNDRSVFEKLQYNLDLSFVRTKLGEQYQRWLQEAMFISSSKTVKQINQYLYQHVELFDEDIGESFNMYILIATLAESSKFMGQQNYAAQLLRTPSESDIENKAMQFFKDNTRSIEISFNGTLFKVFFPVQPTCQNLSKASRTHLMQTVKRDSPNDKINGLLDAASVMFAEMKHMSYLANLPIIFSSRRLVFFQNLCILLASLLNIVMIGGLEIDLVNPVEEKTHLTASKFIGIDYSTLINALGIIQIISSTLMMLFWVIINYPVILKAKWNKYVDSKQTDQKIEGQLKECGNNPSMLTTQEIRYVMKTRGPYSLMLRNRKGQMNFGSFWMKFLYCGKSLVFVCTDSQFLYIFFYIILSIIGFVYDEIVYSLQLLDLINRNEMLKNVLRSVTQNGKQVVLTMFLMGIVLYMYAIVAYWFLSDNFYWRAIDGGENMCHTLFACYLYVIQYGVMNGGGITESLRFLSYQDENKVAYWMRFIYDISFFGIIPVMFINILFGIIIDTFADLRDEKNAMEVDMKSKCYICGIDRWQFDKLADGFDNHIKRDHYLWNYLFYFHYLENKDQTDLNGIESQVMEKMSKHELAWFPIMRSISIRNSVDEGSNFAKKKLN